MVNTHLPYTLGALLLGGLFATILSGVATAQCIFYFVAYPRDTRTLKAFAICIWSNVPLCSLVLTLTHALVFRLVDAMQTSFIWAGLWYYIIQHYCDDLAIDTTPWTVGTAVDYSPTELSNRNKYLGPFIVRLIVPSQLTVPNTRRTSSQFSLCVVQLGLGGGKYEFLSRFLNSYSRPMASDCLSLRPVPHVLLLHGPRRLAIHGGALDPLCHGPVCDDFSCVPAVRESHADDEVCRALHIYANSFFAALNSREGLRRRHSRSQPIRHAQPDKHTFPNKFSRHSQSSHSSSPLHTPTSAWIHLPPSDKPENHEKPTVD
ncbi:hypothetical protein DXG01_016504 [Tephrocybe rancida]|nr:hypothetical protein DXG01_016504 [Tephrocybe rancida]